MSLGWQLTLIGVLIFVISAEVSYYVLRGMTNISQPKLLEWQTIIAVITTALGVYYFG